MSEIRQVLSFADSVPPRRPSTPAVERSRVFTLASEPPAPRNPPPAPRPVADRNVGEASSPPADKPEPRASDRSAHSRTDLPGERKGLTRPDTSNVEDNAAPEAPAAAGTAGETPAESDTPVIEDAAAASSDVAEDADAVVAVEAQLGDTGGLVVALGSAAPPSIAVEQTPVSADDGVTLAAPIGATGETAATPVLPGQPLATSESVVSGGVAAAARLAKPETVEADALTETSGDDDDQKAGTAGGTHSSEAGAKDAKVAESGQQSSDQDRPGAETKSGSDAGQKPDIAKDLKFDLAPGLSFQPPKIGPEVSEAAKLAAAGHLADAHHHDADGRPTPLNAVPLEIGLRALAGAKRFDIRLDPAELGRVDVRLDIDDSGQVKATLRVDRVETMHLLQRDARTLERAFEQAGLKPSDGGIDISLRDQPGQPNQGQAQREAQERQPQRHSATLLVDPDIAEVQAVRRALAPGRIDLTI